MQITSTLAVLAVMAQAVAADWSMSFRDTNTRTERSIGGNSSGCNRFGQAFGYRCTETMYETGQQTSGCLNSAWRPQIVTGQGAAICTFYSRGDCGTDGGNYIRVENGRAPAGWGGRLPGGGNINSFTCTNY